MHSLACGHFQKLHHFDMCFKGHSSSLDSLASGRNDSLIPLAGLGENTQDS